MGNGTHRWLSVVALVAGALAVGAVVVVPARGGDNGSLGLLAVMPGVLVAAFSGRRSTGDCRMPWPRRHER